MDITRRKFLRSGLLLAGSLVSAQQFLTLAARAGQVAPRAAGNKVLVVVQMTGGNDGLNMVIPHGLGQYYQARPTLAVPAQTVLPLTNQIGFNPQMQAVHDLYKQNLVALVQAVGYPEPNRSHFRSLEIWQTACPERIADTGWLGRYLDLSCSGSSDSIENLFAAVNVEPTLPKTLSAQKIMVPSVENVYDFRFRTNAGYRQDHEAQLAAFKDIYQSYNLKRPHAELLRKTGLDASYAAEYLAGVVGKYKGQIDYPNNSFGSGLKFIAQMIGGGVNSRIYTVALDGFDTHTNQERQQNNLLKQFSDGIGAFWQDLSAHGNADDVLILAFSEFGRRVGENNGRGTDHGTAAPVLVIGKSVKGGVYGDHPSLTQLDDGDLKYKVDFRSVYATILDNWMQADARQILGQNFDKLGFV